MALCREKEQKNRHIKKFKILLFIRFYPTRLTFTLSTELKVSHANSLNFCDVYAVLIPLTIFDAHKWKDVIVQGVHSLDGMAPITGRKHSDYRK